MQHATSEFKTLYKIIIIITIKITIINNNNIYIYTIENRQTFRDVTMFHEIVDLPNSLNQFQN